MKAAVQQQRISACLRKFIFSADASMIIFGLFVFAALLLVAGLAVDYMRYDNNRVRVQATSDRAVLAAATLRETGDSEARIAIIHDYFEKAGLSDHLVSVTPSPEAINSSTMTVVTRPGVNTLLMRLIGIDQLQTLEMSTATEEVTNIEISLVLDISGSMRWTDSMGMPRITRLRSAARNFVSAVLPDEDAPQTTTISIVPYAGSVNPGQEVFNLLGGTAWHNYSHCPDLPSSSFDRTGLPDAASMPQTAHFMFWSIDWATMDWGWCPNEANSIFYHSSSEEELHQYLSDLRLHDGTGTHYGVRWGLSLLDPGSRWLTRELSRSGTVNEEHDNRPATWDDDNTLKIIVLMTDGQITDQHRPRRPSRGVFGVDGTLPTEDEQDTLNATAINNLNGSWRRRVSRQSDNVSDFFSACDLAKDNGVVIYTIAFETDSRGQSEMRRCATNIGYFYNVAGLDLEEAFRSIAASIQKLRLTQ